MSLDIALLSDIGKKRRNNEDRGVAFNYFSANFGNTSRIHLPAVADRMGGQLGGEKASDETIRIVSTSLVRAFASVKFRLGHHRFPLASLAQTGPTRPTGASDPSTFGLRDGMFAAPQNPAGFVEFLTEIY